MTSPLDHSAALITNDAVVFGLLAAILGAIFYTANSPLPFWKRLYKVVPLLLLCYLLPSLLNSFNIISSKDSQLWSIAKNYFLPASLVLMTLSIDLKAVLGLGSKALIMFVTATVGIILGGPIAVLVVATISPETVGGEGTEAIWRGLSTVAGSWIGGGANQTAMLELYGFAPEKYSAMVAVDIIVANIWMIFLLYGAGNPEKIDRWLRADSADVERVKLALDKFKCGEPRAIELADLAKIFGVAFAAVGLSHAIAGGATGWLAERELFADSILRSSFFWLVVSATSIGLALSFTRVSQLEQAGASKFGSLFIYLLVVIIGTKMDVMQIFDNPGLIAVGLIWMSFHAALLFAVARWIRAPFFFLAVGSKANVGGAASAPIVAAAFHPALAPVGVLLAVLGYALGTYGAILCARLMQMAATAV